MSLRSSPSVIYIIYVFTDGTASPENPPLNENSDSPNATVALIVFIVIKEFPRLSQYDCLHFY